MRLWELDYKLKVSLTLMLCSYWILVGARVVAAR